MIPQDNRGHVTPTHGTSSHRERSTRPVRYADWMSGTGRRRKERTGRRLPSGGSTQSDPPRVRRPRTPHEDLRRTRQGAANRASSGLPPRGPAFQTIRWSPNFFMTKAAVLDLRHAAHDHSVGRRDCKSLSSSAQVCSAVRRQENCLTRSSPSRTNLSRRPASSDRSAIADAMPAASFFSR